MKNGNVCLISDNAGRWLEALKKDLVVNKTLLKSIYEWIDRDQIVILGKGFSLLRDRIRAQIK